MADPLDMQFREPRDHSGAGASPDTGVCILATDHYLPLFVGDFLASTATWTGPERGLYVQLLMLQWSAKRLPADLGKLARAAGYTKSEFDDLWPVMADKFEVHDGALRNPRLEQHRERNEAVQKARSEAGAKGASARWDGKRMANASVSHRQSDGKKMPSDPIRSESDPEPCRSQSAPDWESHRQWFLDELRSVYPSNLYTDAHWEQAARVMAGKLESGEVDRTTLHRLTLEFAAQQDAKGNRDTKFVENPMRHFDGRGVWKGPFALPPTKPVPGAATSGQHAGVVMR